MIFGEPPKSVQSSLHIGSTGVDESASVLLGYSGGKTALLFSAIRLNTPHQAVIYGEEGSISLAPYWCGDTIRLNNKEGQKEIKLPFGEGGFQFETEEVMSCLELGLLESPTMPHEETLLVMKTLDKIRYDNNLCYPFESDDDINFGKGEM